MTEQAISPLRRRMIEDMTIRKFAQKTQHDYVQRVKDFANYLKRSPDTAKPEDVRAFQLHLTSSGAGGFNDQHHNLGTAVLFQSDA
jgi:integrase/recombinase XerD